jgi:type IV pilus assembly protein PilM
MLSQLTDFLGIRSRGVGLEITPERLNLAQMTKQGANYKLAKLQSLEIPEGIFDEGKILDSPALSEMIQNLLATHKIRAKRVATAVPMREAIVRIISIPAELDDIELRETVLNHEAALYLPYPREEVDLDYQKLDIFEDRDGIEKVQVLLVATRREITDSYVMTLQQAGLQVDVLEIASFSLIRTIRGQLQQFGTKEAVVLVDIEFDSTEIAILVNGIPQFSRSIPIGTFQLQNALSRAMNLPVSRNPEILQSIVIPMSSGDTSVGTRGTAVNPGMSALVRSLGEIADEIRRSINFYLNQNEDLEVVQLLLAGPGGGLLQLDEFFTQRLSLPAIKIDPIGSLSVQLDQDIASIERTGLATVLGLSLREV